MFTVKFLKTRLKAIVPVYLIQDQFEFCNCLQRFPRFVDEPINQPINQQQQQHQWQQQAAAPVSTSSGPCSIFQPASLEIIFRIWILNWMRSEASSQCSSMIELHWLDVSERIQLHDRAALARRFRSHPVQALCPRLQVPAWHSIKNEGSMLTCFCNRRKVACVQRL